MFSNADFAYMQRALALAERGMYTTTPNPRVGCVLIKDGNIIGEGFTQPAGQDHAEVQALKDARSRGISPEGATAYVTLEPCSHFGRTPPCARTLVEAGVARVIAAMEDPNPAVSGRGLAILRQAGIDVRCGLLEKAAAEMNIGFISRMTRRRPWVRLKAAASLDGFTALPSGESQWITGEAARQDGHRWRARACAILTGAGTARQDDPQLTVRGVETPRQPLRVLVDSRLTVPPTARLLDGAPPLIVHAGPPAAANPDDPAEVALAAAKAVLMDNRQSGDVHDPHPHHLATIDPSRDAFLARAEALQARGAELVALPNEAGKVDLPGLMRLLGDRGINELHVEAGTKLSGSLIREGCVDEWLIYLAPSLLGRGFGLFDMPAAGRLIDRRQLVFDSVERIGDDIRILARAVGGNETNAETRDAT
ncbi:diaminohydroxyphosphoribosylaminopyrimidine deaminase [Robbsia andropogonis]|uniref:Riboflavin biosynthesis protein RibD n=1 Tax=Robbsia andropogonis TaxID=28092 RepID=A0A0F5K162_9BURK|nr:bifunctional diaminohydroxyphosphoribosylaminopyrimidine deaminase/5-amino-6-(5-phosphoribosylamino)uracil reductase RibD [Robbsia andropogonis]KKB63861.1 diaminohydroxyphosphoribosylaminopyrimidine deaminase [Robbsia andropogonis]MCP1116651.1 bifunctional diaminohydroxyphosphoribosylaminopyrimidine deaminase/5-amino-6-(5-phosphoribosylamino)uracil reductase RibD [Robbsia andropogonis]MCP1126670.1 bifunctional diaminohydroxyphosphoribosylaminopyrimidine deaminase/5-amino-6-(5-phosphoribosylam